MKDLLKDLGNNTIKVNFQNGTSILGDACDIINNPATTDRDWLFNMKLVDGIVNFYVRND